MKRVTTALTLFIVLFSAVAAAAAPTRLFQQGRLLDGGGVPFEGLHTLVFTAFDDATAGSQLWTETHSLAFEQGYYSVTLGSQEPLHDFLFAGTALWLELEVDGETLSPRQELVSVPYALRSTATEHLEGGSVDAEEIAVDGTVVIDASGNWVGATPSVSWNELSGVPPDLADGDQDTIVTSLPWSSITGVPSDLADGDQDSQLSESQVEGFVTDGPLDLAAGSTVGGQALATGPGVPQGAILMWSGAINAIPAGWALCDGSNGTPDLLDRFITSVPTAATDPGGTGGANNHSLSQAELPSHSHGVDDPGHAHGTQKVCTSGSVSGLTGVVTAQACGFLATNNSTTGISLQAAGGGVAFDKRPAYYELAFIMKL
ncbi:MAG: hypothetical protein VX498_07275 [Myxococcota bacterium]|nr:hypothetical protein [Myxococcota bacterium]